MNFGVNQTVFVQKNRSDFRAGVLLQLGHIWIPESKLNKIMVWNSDIYLIFGVIHLFESMSPKNSRYNQSKHLQKKTNPLKVYVAQKLQ